jgi:hypothetical protein
MLPSLPFLGKSLLEDAMNAYHTNNRWAQGHTWPFLLIRHPIAAQSILILFIYSTFILIWSACIAQFGGAARADIVINSGEQTLSLDKPAEDTRWGTPPRSPETPAWQGWEQNLPYDVVPEVCVPWIPGRGGAHPPAHLRPQKPARGAPVGRGPHSARPAPEEAFAAQAPKELRPELLAELVGGLAPSGLRVDLKPQRLSAVDKGGAKSGGKAGLPGIPPTRGYTPPEKGAPERKVYPSQRPPQLGVNPAQPVYPGEKPPGPRK